jgi:hypothetical protein
LNNLTNNKNLASRFFEDFQSRREQRGALSIPERLKFIKQEIGKGNDVIELCCRFGDILQLVKDENNVIGVAVDRNAMNFCA